MIHKSYSKTTNQHRVMCLNKISIQKPQNFHDQRQISLTFFFILNFLDFSRSSLTFPWPRISLTFSWPVATLQKIQMWGPFMNRMRLQSNIAALGIKPRHWGYELNLLLLSYNTRPDTLTDDRRNNVKCHGSVWVNCQFYEMTNFTNGKQSVWAEWICIPNFIKICVNVDQQDRQADNPVTRHFSPKQDTFPAVSLQKFAFKSYICNSVSHRVSSAATNSFLHTNVVWKENVSILHTFCSFIHLLKTQLRHFGCQDFSIKFARFHSLHFAFFFSGHILKLNFKLSSIQLVCFFLYWHIMPFQQLIHVCRNTS